MMARIALFVVLLACGTWAHGEPDYAREARWAAEIAPAIVVGDVVQLETASGRAFLGIYTAPAGAGAGIVVVHGIGVHPDWGIVNVLRSGLADRGYATLSIQMPLLGASASAAQYPPLFPEAAERLKAAVRFLHQRGLEKVAIVAHSLGARMTDYFVGHNEDPRIAAWVAIGLSGELTARQPSPILDVYGEHDRPAVLASAGRRAAVLRTVRRSAQVEIAAADHFYTGREAELVKHVSLFLDRTLK
jgi:pimeloyl-ACP methyl ester carboxylesterase